MDFRSDTVTRPTESMRAVMAAAPVGDDVYRDDPSVAELERYAADLTGTEAALFACSGTMGNLLALLVHGRRGESVLLGAQSHIYHYEVGGLSALAGLLPYALDDESGLPEVASLAGAVRGRTTCTLPPPPCSVWRTPTIGREGWPFPLRPWGRWRRKGIVWG